MNYINTTTGQYPVTEQQIRREHPLTIFGATFEPPEPYRLVFLAAQPTYNPVLEMLREAAPALSIKGQYEQQWQVVQRYASQSEIAAAVASATVANVEALQNQIVDAVQERLDTFAKTRNYDSILSATTYASSAVPRFNAEGQYAVNARDATWAKLYAILGAVQAGTHPMPQGYADIEAELPTLVWPA